MIDSLNILIMAYTQQRINSVFFKKLKGLKNLTIEFDSKNLHGILGPNGSGKSTIIHALSCIYKPINDTATNYKFSHFFTPTPHGSWEGSRFTLYHSYREEEEEFNNVPIEYSKAIDRWAPRYDTRPARHVSFIGIRSCVPMIELEVQQNRIQFNTQILSDAPSNKIKSFASAILNRNYQSYTKHSTSKGKNYLGVRHLDIDYSSLSMGAGEQRVFYILTEIVNCPKYSLIIIDEIDLLLHKDALKKLLVKINEIAEEKHLQIIFTTHDHTILNLDFINYSHLLQTKSKTLCFKNTKPDAVQRLTGEQLRPIEIFVEDDFAKSLIYKIAAELGIAKYVSIEEYGPADNCFIIAAGIFLRNTPNIKNMLCVLDGDMYNTLLSKEKQLKRTLTGDTVALKSKRELVLQKIKQFILPESINPEKYYHSLIVNINKSSLSPEEKEIQNIARQIEHVSDNHTYIDDIIDRLGYTREAGLKVISDIISKSSKWEDSTVEIREWLISKKTEFVEIPS